MCKLMYTWNPFGFIKRRNKNLDDYIKNVFFASNEALNNLDYGMGVMKAKVALVSSFAPYLMLIISLEKYLKPDLFSKEPLTTFWIVALCFSSLKTI
jgi:hypothetical protein